MNTVITDIEQITPQWLTHLLQGKEYVKNGHVTDVRQIKVGHTNVSTVYHLLINYSAQSASGPTRLFVKLPNPSVVGDQREVEFYCVLVPVMLQSFSDHPWLFPFCYDAAYSPTTNQSHIILEDISATHFTNEERMPPSERLCTLVIDAYACFHAYWWEHPQLGRSIGELLSNATIDGFLDQARRQLNRFLAFTGSQVDNAQRKLLTAVVTAWPLRRRQRVVQGQGITLVHRDPHPRNFLYPRDPDQHTVKLIDWQSWRVDTGTDDLAYLMACHWPLERTGPREEELLKRYYAQLTRYGVKDYTWQDCRYDYRASIVRCLFFLLVAWSPVQWEQGIWWERLQLGMASYARWKCTEILPE